MFISIQLFMNRSAIKKMKGSKQLKFGMLVLLWPIIFSCQESKSTIDMNISENAVQFRIARPTNQLEKIKVFYTQGLGMKELGSFSGHDGYSGIMLGLPGHSYHLEFTEHPNQQQLPPPTKENLLVFYFDTPEKYERANQQLQSFGTQPVEPENPYWKGKSETYEDPDKWRIVFYNGLYPNR